MGPREFVVFLREYEGYILDAGTGEPLQRSELNRMRDVGHAAEDVELALIAPREDGCAVGIEVLVGLESVDRDELGPGDDQAALGLVDDRIFLARRRGSGHLRAGGSHGLGLAPLGQVERERDPRWLRRLQFEPEQIQKRQELLVGQDRKSVV